MAESNPTQVILTDDGIKIIKAQDTADNAASGITNLNDPNYLSPFEKPQLEIQMDGFAANYAADKDIATSEGIDFTAYDAAYQAYLAYMTPLVADMTTYSPIVRVTFNSMVTAVQVEQKRFSTATQAQYDQQIKKAQTDIDDGQTKYKALQSEAEVMKSSVAGISDAADRAISSAGFASNAASAASQGANEASQAASSALASATSAQSDASSAVAKAESTASAFGPVSQKADSAFTNAMSAQSDASAAVAQASSAAADSKDAKQIAGAVSQSYKTLTDGSTMTIAELQNGLAAKLTKTDLNGYATQDWAQTQIKITSDGINGTISSVKSTVDSQTTSINDLKADSSSFKSQFTTVNDTIGKNSKDINGKLTTLQGSFDASSKKLSSTISKVDNMQIGGTNLLRNTDFNPFTAPWSYATSVVSMEGNSEVPIGAPSSNKTILIRSKVALEGNGSKDSGKGLLYSTPNVKAGIVYTFSAWVRASISEPSSKWVAESNGERFYFDIMPGKWQRVSGQITFQTDKRALYIYQATTGTARLLCISSPKLEQGNKATDWSPAPEDNATVTALTQIKQTADSAETIATNNQGDIAKLQVTAHGLQSTVSDKASSDQLTQLSGQLTNEIKDLSSSTNSKFTQTANDINGMVKKGDVANQFNLDAGGALLSTTGNKTKIVFSAPNIIFDTNNPVQIPNANIPGVLTNKTFEAGTITAKTKIIGTDIESPLIHSPSGSFKLDGNTGDIIGASIHSANNSWGIDKDGIINGATINTPTLDLGFNGTFTENFDYTQPASLFLAKKNKGTLTFNHGVLQSRGTMQTYLNGQWGGMDDNLVFKSGINNSQWTEVAPGYIKLDLFKQNGTGVAERTYTDPTGYYYTSTSGNNSYLGNVLQTPQVQTASVLTKYIGPSKGQLRLQIGNNGKDYGLQVGSYGGKEAVLSDFIYNTTYSNSPNVYITPNGHLVRTTSASKYKYNIKNPDIETTLGDRLLNIHLATWNDKHAVDSYAEQLSTGEEREKSSIDKYYGLIAEQLRDAGLDMFISYGKNHEIEGVQYDRAWIPLLSVIRRLNNKVNEYELRLSKLEGVSK